MSLESELVSIEVQIKDNQEGFSQKLQETEQKTIDLRNEIQRLEKATAFLALTNQKGSVQYKELDDRLKEARKELKASTDDAKNYSKALDINSMSANQLSKRANDLRNTLNSMRKEANPAEWNKLNKEYNETTKRLSEVRAGTEQTSATMSVMKGVLGGFSIATVVSMVGNGLKKIGSDVLDSTQTISDSWGRMTTGMSYAYSTFLKAIATGDWSNFFSNLGEAYELGRKVADMLDELFEMGNSRDLQAININQQIAELKITMDDVNQSDEVRKKAAEDVIKLTKELGELNQKVASQEREAYERKFNFTTKMTAAEKDFFIEKYIKNKEAIDQAGSLIKLENDLLSMRKNQYKYVGELLVQNYSDEQINGLEKRISLIKQNNKEVEYAAGVLKKYNQANDKEIKNYVTALANERNVQVEVTQSIRRIERQKNSLIKSINDEAIKRQQDYNKQTKEEREKSYKEEIEAAETEGKNKLAVIQKQYLERTIDQVEFNEKSTVIEEEVLTKKIEINTLYGKKVSDEYKRLYEIQIARMEEYKKKLDEIVAESNKSVEKTADAWTKSDQASIDKAISETQELFDKAAEAAGKYLTAHKTELDELQVKYNSELDLLKTARDASQITEEEYLIAVNKLYEKYDNEKDKIIAKGWAQGIEVALDALNQMAGISSAIQEAQLSRLERDKERELAIYGDSSEKREQIELKFEQKKLDIQKKFADLDMGLKIAQATAAGALAIAQTIGNLGLPKALPAIIIAGIMTAANIATIVAQRNAIKNSTVSGVSTGGYGSRTVNSGYSDGGFTGYGQRLEPAGVVHKGEYVVPMPEMRIPAVQYHVREIESYRRQRTSSNALPGYADGGYVLPGENPDSSIKVMYELLSYLKFLKKNPIKAFYVNSEQEASRIGTERIKSMGTLS